MSRRLTDLAGETFGRWAVLSFAGIGSARHATWHVRCSCGTEKVVNGAALRNGQSTSCGCFARELAAQNCGALNKTHGMKGTSMHRIWTAMLQRCRNPKCSDYGYYGGRGINVCERWTSFENFYADMGARPAGMTLDRTDNNKGYSPENCRWATQREQVQNSRTVRLLEHEGERHCVAEWSRRTGIHQNTIYRRLKRGLSVAASLTKAIYE